MADFTGPDGKELTDHQDAKKNYDRLVKQKGLYNSDEINLINFVRECYRRSYPQQDAKKTQFLNGGALVFNGANVRLNDNGYYYAMWTNIANLTLHERTGTLSGSSHASDRDQYEIYLDEAGVFLVGMCRSFAGVPFGPHTWFQSERHAGAGNVLQRAGHLFSFIDHITHGDKQVGAFGYSDYSEKRGNALLVENITPYPSN
jgi:hypothetical protein